VSSRRESPAVILFRLLEGSVATKFKTIVSILTVVLLTASTCIRANDEEKKRQKTREMAAEVLQGLYKAESSVQATIQKAAGYAVFNNMGVNVLLLSTARGSGLAVSNKTKKEPL
jgi:hypothetical protein